MRPVPTSIAAKVARAAELFAERGVEQTKIDDIAEVTGVPKTTLYYYFVGKDEILVFLQRDLIVEVADAVSIAVESDGTAADRLREVVRAQLRVMAERPAVWRAFVANLGRAIQLPELVEVLDTAYYAPVRDLLHQGVADGSLRPMDDATTVAMAVFGAATLAGLRHVLAGEPLDVDRIADHVSAIVIGGMGAS
jgi:TetR/AcrR family transcriptional regulator